MKLPRTQFLGILLLAAVAGCHPTQPFYFHERGDLAHYLDQATEIADPDTNVERLAEVDNALPPLLLSDPEHSKEWDITLEEAINVALQNSKVIRNLGAVTQFGFADGLTGRTAVSTTVYDPAIFETDPQSGVEAALANFDAQFTTNVFWQRLDRPQNLFSRTIFEQEQAQVDMAITKLTANGTQITARNQYIYDGNNSGSLVSTGRVLPSDWFVAFELEARQPLLRGRGTQINRIPVMLARINTDISIATFESGIRNLIMDIETTYWDLHCAYRQLETAKAGRDSAQVTWKVTYEKWKAGTETIQAEAQSREQYFFFRSQVETAWRDLLNLENRLRWLMGLAPTDGRILRPVDEPVQAAVTFDWQASHLEALMRSMELRQQRWTIKRRELELINARNQLLPDLSVVALYRWLGLGDQLGRANRVGSNFPDTGSQAFDELTENNYGEWRIGIDFTPPRFGARREYAGVRNAQLGLFREKERLRDMELNTSHLLTGSIRTMDSNYVLAKSHFNRWAAAEEEVQSIEVLYEGNKISLDRVLDAQRRRAQAQIDYYRAICEYTKAIADVHFRKGSLLETHAISLTEGPWPEKAYWDALGRARERDASKYMNYGWTRPNVISRGPVDHESVEEVSPLEQDAPLQQQQPQQDTLPPKPMTEGQTSKTDATAAGYIRVN